MKFNQFYKLLESKKAKKEAVIYSGRFQPFHPGHYETYENLVKKFGSDNVYIATSNKIEANKSPLNFKEKKAIIESFGINSNKIVQVKNPYAPAEILETLPDDTVYITVVGAKDAERLSKGKYFDMYSNDSTQPHADKGYIFVAPKNTTTYDNRALSGTYVRELLSGDKEEIIKKLYPKISSKAKKILEEKF